MPKTGRPTKFTPEIQKTICDAISAAIPVQVASAMAGIDHGTFYRWIKKNKDFCQAIKKATAIAEGRLVATIGRAAAKQWTAAAWLLERHPKHRERWAKPGMGIGATSLTIGQNGTSASTGPVVAAPANLTSSSDQSKP
jgi:hypothetical protein